MPEQDSTPTPIVPIFAFMLIWYAIVIKLWFFFAQGAREIQLFMLTLTAYLACWAPYFVFSLRSRRKKAIRFVVFNGSTLISLAVIELLAPLGLVNYRHVLGNRVAP